MAAYPSTREPPLSFVSWTTTSVIDFTLAGEGERHDIRHIEVTS